MAAYQKQLAVQPATHDLLVDVQAEFQERTGEKMPFTTIVHRAALCYLDSIKGDRWLNGKEAGKAMEARHQYWLLDILGRLVPNLSDGKESLSGVSFDPTRNLAFLHLEGGEVRAFSYYGLATPPDKVAAEPEPVLTALDAARVSLAEGT